MLPAEYSDKHSSNTADAFEAEKEICEKCKISPAADPFIEKIFFFQIKSILKQLHHKYLNCRM